MIKLLTILLYGLIIPKTDYDLVSQAKNVQSKYHPTNKRYVVLIDYSKSIDSERLYVVDVVKSSVILKSTVAHARRSGNDIPYVFSNEPNTKKSSLGAYITKGTYYGSYGYSLKIKGMDKTNSNAENRYIIFHSTKLMKTKWSWGCFATPDGVNRKLIDIIKGGCLVYVYKS
jgi:hypothetical protein